MKNTYIALIGDIIFSKKLENRGLVQNRLNDILQKINILYAGDLSSKFMITLGDEFQGLLHRGENLINIIEEIEYKMHPVKIRFGIGIGEITTGIIYEMPLGADGPAYYNARAAVERLKGRSGRLSGNNIALESNEKKTELLINTVFSLLSVLKSNFTEKQRDVCHYAFSCSCKQADIALKFNISQASVNGILKSAKYSQYREAMEALKTVFGEIEQNV